MYSIEMHGLKHKLLNLPVLRINEIIIAAFINNKYFGYKYDLGHAQFIDSTNLCKTTNLVAISDLVATQQNNNFYCLIQFVRMSQIHV